MRRRLPPLEELRRLREGADIGRQRTYAEIAQMFGVAEDSVGDRLRGRTRKPTTRNYKVTDPRPFFPHLADQISDEAVKDWFEQQMCVCGCGEKTRLKMGKGPMPNGTPNLLKPGHQARMPVHHERFVQSNSDEQKNAIRAQAYRDAHNVPTDVLAIILAEHHATTGESAMAVGKRAGVGSIYDVFKRATVRRYTAAAILAAIGEPLRPEMRRALAEHRLRLKKRELGLP